MTFYTDQIAIIKKLERCAFQKEIGISTLESNSRLILHKTKDDIINVPFKTKTYVLNGTVTRSINGIKVFGKVDKINIVDTFNEFERIYTPNLGFSYQEIESIDNIFIDYPDTVKQICFPITYEEYVIDAQAGSNINVRQNDIIVLSDDCELEFDGSILNDMLYKISSDKVLKCNASGKILVIKEQNIAIEDINDYK